MKWLLALIFAGLTVPALAAFAIFTTTASNLDPTHGLLPSDRDAYANWKVAGLQSIGGIPNRTAQCGSTVSPIGGGSDDTANIQAAINACTADGNHFVLLSLGTFTIAEGSSAFINGPITLRGSGPCAGTGISYSNGYPSSAQSYCTLVQRTGGAVFGTNRAGASPSPHFVLGADSNGNFLEGTPIALTADIPQGASTASVASTAGLYVGEEVFLIENADLNWEPNSGSIWWISGQQQWSEADYRLNWYALNPTCPTHAEYCQGGSTNPGIACFFGMTNTSGTTNQECDGYTNEIKVISAIGTNTVTFSSPATISYRLSHTAHIAPVYGGKYYGGLNITVTTNAGGDRLSNFPGGYIGQSIVTGSAFRFTSSADGLSTTTTYYITSINTGSAYATFSASQAGVNYVGASCSGGCAAGSLLQLPASQAGLENLTMQNADNGSVVMVACAYCWLKNTENTVDYNNNTGGVLNVIAGFRDQFEGVYSHLTAAANSGGGNYEWGINMDSTEILVENSISMLADKVMVVRQSGAGSVFAYNYYDDCVLEDSAVGETEVGMNASHWIGSHNVLFEGNWTFQASSDPVWGPSIVNTFFRNDVTGFRTPFFNPYQSFTINDAANIPGFFPQNDATVLAFAGNNYWESFVGNVLGTSGGMAGWSFQSNNAQSIYQTGYWNGGDFPSNPDGEVYSATAGASACVTTDGDACPLIRLSNYDYVTNSLNDPSNPAIPNSFYTAGAPAFFRAGSGYTWPWVNSQGSTKVRSGPTTSGCTANFGGPCSGLPAKARIDNGTPFVQP